MKVLTEIHRATLPIVALRIEPSHREVRGFLKALDEGNHKTDPVFLTIRKAAQTGYDATQG